MSTNVNPPNKLLVRPRPMWSMGAPPVPTLPLRFGNCQCNCHQFPGKYVHWQPCCSWKSLAPVAAVAPTPRELAREKVR